MKNKELIEMLTDAQEHLFSAIELIESYVKETGDDYAKAYLLDHLKIMASNDHEFMSRDLNLSDLISGIEED